MKPWDWARPGRDAGRLMGGCLESLEHLRGTPFWPEIDSTCRRFSIVEGAVVP